MLGQTGSEGSTGLRSLAIRREYRRRRLRKRKKVRHSRLNWRFLEDHPWFCGLGWLFFSFSFFVFCFFPFRFHFFFWNATAYFAQFAIRGYTPGKWSFPSKLLHWFLFTFFTLYQHAEEKIGLLQLKVSCWKQSSKKKKKKTQPTALCQNGFHWIWIAWRDAHRPIVQLNGCIDLWLTFGMY